MDGSEAMERNGLEAMEWKMIWTGIEWKVDKQWNMQWNVNNGAKRLVVDGRNAV